MLQCAPCSVFYHKVVNFRVLSVIFAFGLTLTILSIGQQLYSQPTPIMTSRDELLNSVIERLKSTNITRLLMRTADTTSQKNKPVPVIMPEQDGVKYEDGFKATPANRLQSMTLVQLYERYLELVTKPTYSCQRDIRFGNEADGGWQACMDEPYTLKKPCLVYSFGINWDFSFDEHIAKEVGCKVHSFDPSMNTASFNLSRNVHFHDFGIKGRGDLHQDPEWKLSTFQDTLKLLGHENTVIDYLKIDVEHAEWRSLASMLSDQNHFRHVRQVGLEFHVWPGVTQSELVSYVNILETMRQIGLEIYRSHLNLWGLERANKIMGGKTTCCHEVNFVNNKFYYPHW